MTRKSNMYIGGTFVALIVALAVAQTWLADAAAEKVSDAQGSTTAEVPYFEYDPTFPKYLPDQTWVMGAVIGVAVDSKDNIWMVHRPNTLDEVHSLLKGEIGLVPRAPGAGHTGHRDNNPPTAEFCCRPAPPVLEFDQAGNLVSHWGGPGNGFDWPRSEHGIFVDHKDNVWVGDSGGQHILKFTRQGKFLLQIGKRNPKPSNFSTTDLGSPAGIEVDPKTNEVYVADGYRNTRVIVFDADTGAYKRMWGAYGNKPNDDPEPAYDPKVAHQQFHTPVHCSPIANDGLVYVCDREGDRIQVFTKDGKFVKEAFVARNTLESGSVWDIDFSKDPQQRYIYLADGMNSRVHILLRDTLQEVAFFGRGGHYPGQFFGAHSIATDSKGNIYVGETWEGKRLQRFVYKGMRRPTDH